LRVSRLVAAACVCALAAAAPARAEEIAREQAATSVAVHGTYSAWSHFDGRRFRLVLWHDGTLETAPIPSRAAAFDVDLGLDRRGRLVAVYSRCAKTFPQLPRETPPIHAYDTRCDLYRYDVLSRREARIAQPSRKRTSEFLPAIAGGRLVFARQEPAPPRLDPRIPAIVSARMSPYREQALARPAGRAGDAAVGGNLGPLSIDADRGRAVVGWSQVPHRRTCGDLDPRADPPTVHDVLLYDLRDRSRRTLEDDCHSIARGSGFASPSLDDSAVFYDLYLPDASTHSVARLDLATRARTAMPVAGELLSTQTGGGYTWTAAVASVTDHTVVISRTRA